MKKLLKVFPIIIVLCFISFSGCKKEVPCTCGNPAGVVYVDYFGAPPTYKTLEEYLLEADGIVYATYTGKYEVVYIHSEFEENIFKKPDPCCCHGGEKYLLMADPQSKEDSIFKVCVDTTKTAIYDKNGEPIDGLFSYQFHNYWEKGKTYILLVKELDTGENDGVKRYTMISDAVIPVDGGEATLYSESIENHSTGYNGEGSIEEYIKEFLKNNAE